MARAAALGVAAGLAFAAYVWAEPLVLEPDRSTTESVIGAEVSLIGYRSTTLGGRVRSAWKDFWRWSPERALPSPPPPAAQWNYAVDFPEGYSPPAPFECTATGSDVLDCYATVDGIAYRVNVIRGRGVASVNIPDV